MPPQGLWPIPRHHLYGSPTQRPTFNAKDFDKDEPDQPIFDTIDYETHESEHGVSVEARKIMKIDGDVNSGVVSTTHHSVSDHQRSMEGTRAERKKRKREKKLQRLNSATSLATTATIPGAQTPAASATADRPAVKNADLSKSFASVGVIPQSEYERTAHEQGKRFITDRHTEPETNKSAHRRSASKVDKKRKRTSEIPDITRNESTDLKSESVSAFPVGQELVKEVESLLAGIGDSFARSIQKPEVKKVKKSKTEKKLEKQFPVGRSLLGGSQHPIHNSVGEGANGAPPKKQKKRKRETDTNAQCTDKKVADSSPKKTPIPLPSPHRPTTFEEFHKSPAWKKAVIDGAVSPGSEIMVPETPPSVAAKNLLIKTPIPLPKLSPLGFHPCKEVHRGHDGPPSGLQVNDYRSTPASGNKLTQPLKDEAKPKPKPRTKRSGSLSSSSGTSSRASSVSIVDMFARVPKEHIKSDKMANPFISTAGPQDQNQPSPTRHNEATLEKFNKLYHEFQNMMNFEAEQEYLNQYQDWQVGNTYTEYAFPCLGAGSGCTPKKEGILRLSKEKDSLSVKKAVAASGGDTTVLHEAAGRGKQGENFLVNAIHARIPVPVGHLGGMWTLYCPQYSAHHYDRYGYGARTLTIYTISGFKDKNAYTARLCIPPRSMPYTILTFSVPPHASFRRTVVKTAPEGYEMDLLFLGNGYLKLRVDLNLLLKGKPTEDVGGRKVWMEFLGVHEGAVEWAAETKTEGEEEMRNLLARFGGLEG